MLAFTFTQAHLNTAAPVKGGQRATFSKIVVRSTLDVVLVEAGAGKFELTYALGVRERDAFALSLRHIALWVNARSVAGFAPGVVEPAFLGRVVHHVFRF